MLLLCHSHIPL